MKYKLIYSPEFRADIKSMVGDIRLVLGSNSPRRSDILGLLGLDFVKIIPEVDENIDPDKPPVDYAVELALMKVSAIEYGDPGVIIAADTIVVLNGRIINKPVDDEHAREMLGILSGNTHIVITAVALKDTVRGKIVYGHSESKVTFRPLSDARIREYVDSREPFGKAGGYAMQGRGGDLVESFQGDLDNIIGFPAGLFRDLLFKLKSEV